MDIVLIVLLAVDAALLIGAIIFQLVRRSKIAGQDEIVSASETAPVAATEDVTEKETEQEPVEEAVEEHAEEAVEETAEEEQESEEVVEETAEEEQEPAEEAVEETAEEDQESEEEETEDDDELAVADESEEDGLFSELAAKRKPSIPFYTKMLSADEKLQTYYNTVKNEFKWYKGINARVSKKCDSFRKGRELIAKLTLAGKTIKLYLKLNPSMYDENRFHQRYAGDKKSYAEVPMLVKVRSDRACANAILLIRDLMSDEDAPRKTRYTEVDFIEALRDYEE